MRILFYSSVSDNNLFNITGFYVHDIKALELQNHKVITTNSYLTFLKFWKYDVSFLYFYKKSIIPGLISFFYKKIIIYTGGIDELSNEIQISRLNYFIYKSLFILNYSISDYCNIVSQNDLITTKSILNKIGFISTKKLIYFPHCIDVDYLLQNTNDIIKENIITTICWMGSVANVKRKGVDKSLIFFEKIIKVYPDFKFYIIGTQGDGKLYLDTIITKYNLSNNVIYTGPINDFEKIKILSKSKFYFQLSEYEGFGLAVIEAMLSYNFIIHSGKGGLIDTIGNNGLVIDKDEDLNKTFEKFIKVYDDISNNYSLLEKNKKYVITNFNIKTRSYNFNQLILNEK